MQARATRTTRTALSTVRYGELHAANEIGNAISRCDVTAGQFFLVWHAHTAFAGTDARGVRGRGAVAYSTVWAGLFVHTQVIIPVDLPCTCTYVHVSLAVYFCIFLFLLFSNTYLT